MTDQLDRKFIRPRQDELEQVAEFEWPEMATELTEETNALGMAADWYQEQVEQAALPEEEPEPTFPALTAEELEAIRQAAYEDGFAEGKQAGYEEGLPQGQEAGQQQGYEAGMTEGLEAGKAQGLAEMENLAQRWRALMMCFTEPLSKLDAEVELELIRLAMGLAESLIQTEAKTNQQVLLQTLKLGVEALPINEQAITIKMHPDDLALIEQFYAEEERDKRGWTLMAEPSMPPGDIQCQTELSSVELVMEQRIKQLMRRFLQENHAV